MTHPRISTPALKQAQRFVAPVERVRDRPLRKRARELGDMAIYHEAVTREFDVKRWGQRNVWWLR